MAHRASLFLLSTRPLAPPPCPPSSRLFPRDCYPSSQANSLRTPQYAANSGGTGEPINVVVSGDSDEVVHTADGFYDWSLSINFGSYLLDSQGVGSYAGECLGQTDGERQAANLGDGLGIRASSSSPFFCRRRGPLCVLCTLTTFC